MNVTAALLSSLGCTRAQFDARCEEIATLLSRSDKAVETAIVRIYDRQTRDEKSANETVHHNGIGFQACDAKRGGYWARLILSGRHLFADRMPKARSMTIKYRRQLAVLSFIKDMERSMPAGSKTSNMLERALREPEREANRRERNLCGTCGEQRCPDGCCCAC